MDSIATLPKVKRQIQTQVCFMVKSAHNPRTGGKAVRWGFDGLSLITGMEISAVWRPGNLSPKVPIIVPGTSGFSFMALAGNELEAEKYLGPKAKCAL